MKTPIKKITFIALIVLVSLSNSFLFAQQFNAAVPRGERIVYSIHPLGGTSEYNDLGMTELEGKRVRLAIFKTRVLGFNDTEKIYSDPNTLLPVRVERNVAGWFGKENIVEEYDQKNFTVTIKKFKGNKKVNEQVLKAGGSIANPILVPLYPRSLTNLYLGWNFIFRIPKKFEVKLVSIDTIKVAGRKYQAYHFTSFPDKFEIWINKDEPRIPLKIKGKGGFNYTLVMKEYSKAGAKEK